MVSSQTISGLVLYASTINERQRLVHVVIYAHVYLVVESFSGDKIIVHFVKNMQRILRNISLMTLTDREELNGGLITNLSLIHI